MQIKPPHLGLALLLVVLGLAAYLAWTSDGDAPTTVSPPDQTATPAKGTQPSIPESLAVHADRSPTYANGWWSVRVETKEGEQVSPSSLTSIVFAGEALPTEQAPASNSTPPLSLQIPINAEGGRLQVVLASYGSGETTLVPGKEDFTVVLIPDGPAQIHGTTTWTATNAPVGNALVLCWPMQSPKSYGEMETAARRQYQPNVRQTHSDADGPFSILGLRQGTKYHVTAVSEGGIASQPVLNVTASKETSGISLPMNRLLAQRVSLDCQPQASETASRRLWGGAGTNMDSQDEAFETRSLGNARLELIAFGIAQADLESSPYDQTLLLESESSLASFGNGSVTFDVPGYPRTEVPIQAGLLTVPLATTRVPIQEETAGRGRITFAFDHVSPGGREWIERDLRLGVLIGTDDSESWGYPIFGSDLFDGGVIEGVPFGTYDLSFWSTSITTGICDFGAYKSVSLDSGNASVDIRVRLGDLGGTSVHVLAAGTQDEYSGPLSLKIRKPHSKIGFEDRYISFSAPPYVIPLLQEATYKVHVNSAYGITFSDLDDVDVFVRAGKITDVYLVGAPAK